MAAQRTAPFVLFAVLLVFGASTSRAQIAPGWSGGGAIKRIDVPSTQGTRSWSFRDRLPSPSWTTARWLPGPRVGGTSVSAVRAQRRTWPWGRLP